jgi:hypothetical protein
MSGAPQRPGGPIAAKEHPVVQAGRDYWRPHTELQLLRERIEVLEALHDRDSLTIEAIARAAIALTTAHDKRIAALEAKLNGKGPPA